MRRAAPDCGFWLCLLLNVIFHIQWSVPGFLLLLLHFVLGWPLWYSLVAFGVWFGYVLTVTIILSCLSRLDNTGPDYRENKNPYSVGQEKNND